MGPHLKGEVPHLYLLLSDLPLEDVSRQVLHHPGPTKLPLAHVIRPRPQGGGGLSRARMQACEPAHCILGLAGCEELREWADGGARSSAGRHKNASGQAGRLACVGW